MKAAASVEERSELDARQSSYKILINSFYGQLGFSLGLLRAGVEEARDRGYRVMRCQPAEIETSFSYAALGDLLCTDVHALSITALRHLPATRLGITLTFEPLFLLVVVLGGGDTGMDCVRTAIRQGAASVTCASASAGPIVSRS